MVTYALSTILRTPSGDPLVGAAVSAVLDKPDFTADGSVIPVGVYGNSDETGAVSLDLVSNLDGTQDSRYVVSVMVAGSVVFSGSIQMPQADSDLENLVDVTPVTPEYTTAAALSAAQALAARNEAVPAAAAATAARNEAVPAAETAVEAAEEAVAAAERTNTLFWLGV